MLDTFKNKIRWHFFYKKWRKKNQHNNTAPKNFFNLQCVDVGKYTYGELEVHHFGTENKLEIGNFCSIAPHVSFFLKDDHPINLLSTFPFKVKCLNMNSIEAVSKGDIILEDDVWIGYGAIVLSGVRISQGAVVGAGAVVTKNVPPYAIVAGNPARIVKYRFDEQTIEKLLKIDFSALEEDNIRNNLDDLYCKDRDFDELLWIPRK